MSGISVFVVPTWAVWIFVALCVVNIAQHLWKLWLLRKIEGGKQRGSLIEPDNPWPRA